MTITKDMLISEVLKAGEQIVPVLLNAGMHCLGCPSAQSETLAEAAAVHGIDADKLVEDLNAAIA